MGAADAGRQGARLEARALPAADVAHVDAPGPPPGHPTGDEVHGLVGGVVQHLDLKGARRIIERAGGVDHPAGDRSLVVQGQLDGDPGPPTRPRARQLRGRAAAQQQQIGPMGGERQQQGQNRQGEADDDLRE